MSSNPMLSSRITQNASLEIEKPMSIVGAVNKTMGLILIVMAVAVYAWSVCATGYTDKANLLTIMGVVAGLILAIITTFKPKTSPITAPAYAICEGLVVGTVSYSYGAMFNGIIQNAILITIATLFAMLFLYKSGLIKATPLFRKIVITSTIGIAIFYLISFIASFSGFHMTLFNGGMLGIGVSLLICAIAAFNFILDFDFLEEASKKQLPKYFEWYGAFAILVTLIWLYFEVLRLLAQLNSRD